MLVSSTKTASMQDFFAFFGNITDIIMKDGYFVYYVIKGRSLKFHQLLKMAHLHENAYS